MLKLPPAEILARLPVDEMEQTLSEFVGPRSELLPEKRLRRIVPLAMRGILTNETPVIAAIAQSVSRQEAECWAAAKRIYRFLENQRFKHHLLFKGLYEIARCGVARAAPDFLAVFATQMQSQERRKVAFYSSRKISYRIK